VRGSHETGAYDHYTFQQLPHGTVRVVTRYHHHATSTRGHSVVVPNVGGFAGVSFNFPNAKASFGYRADFFFGALDGGLDIRQARDVSFHGLFANISIGLGG
jgi:hypothetical protein